MWPDSTVAAEALAALLAGRVGGPAAPRFLAELVAAEALDALLAGRTESDDDD